MLTTEAKFTSTPVPPAAAPGSSRSNSKALMSIAGYGDAEGDGRWAAEAAKAADAEAEGHEADDEPVVIEEGVE